MQVAKTHYLTTNTLYSQNKSNPAFGWKLSNAQAKLLKHLPPERRKQFSSQMLSLDVISIEKTRPASRSRDKVLRAALAEARAIKNAQRKHAISDFIKKVFHLTTKKAA